jgi:hypothetical protein
MTMELPKFYTTIGGNTPKKETCCESSLMFNVRFRRCKLLNQLLPFLALLSIFANVYLVANRKQYIVPLSNDLSAPSVSYLEIPITTQFQEPRRLQQHYDRKEQLSQFIKTNEEIMQMELDAKKKRRRSGPKLLVPQAPALSENATFSACLLIKDDNAILSEWIAYHYHTVNLRHLIVAVDPSSVESPETILNRWRDNTDIEVYQWSDVDFMPQSFIDSGYLPKEYIQDESDFEGMSPKAYVLSSIFSLN